MSYHRPSTTQTVSISGTSAATTNAVGTQTYAIRLICTQPVHIAFGASPTATTADFYMAASREECFKISPGEKVAGIEGGTGGTLYVTELTY